jgi:hypothetical protein
LPYLTLQCRGRFFITERLSHRLALGHGVQHKLQAQHAGRSVEVEAAQADTDLFEIFRLRRIHLRSDPAETIRVRAQPVTADALAIYEAVTRRKPLRILELGPGTSSAVIGLAIAQVQKSDPDYSPRFIAIEENEKWLSYHETKFPPALRGKVKMIHRPSTGASLHSVPVARYSDVPRLPYDFIHVDGPDHLAHGAAVGCDLVDLAPTLAPECYVVFDGRQASARFAIKHLRGVSAKHHLYSLNYELSISRQAIPA